MAEVKLVYPATGLTSPSSWGSKESIKKMMETILSKYGTYIDFVSKESNLPKEMITSFIAVESGGNPTAGSSGHVTQGLMQWNRTYAKAQLEKEKKLEEEALKVAEKKRKAAYELGMKDLEFEDIAS